MEDFTAKSPSPRAPATELWRKTLSQIPTVFGRLVFLASLRDEATGRYGHAALNRLLGADDADRTLCHSHHQVFSQWIAFSLAEQKMDLDEYVVSAGVRSHFLRRYRDLAPSMARDVERQLYLTDLETLLELLRFGHDAASIRGA